MGLRERVIQIASQEASNHVGLGTNQDRALEYFLASTGMKFSVDDAKVISWCTYFAHWVLRTAGVHPLPVQGYVGALKKEKKQVAAEQQSLRTFIDRLKARGEDVTELQQLPGQVRSYGGFAQTVADDDNNWEVVNPWTGQPEYKPAAKGISSTSRFMSQYGGVYAYHEVKGGVCRDGYVPQGGDLYYKPLNWVTRVIDNKPVLVHEDVQHLGLIKEVVPGGGLITLDGNSGDPVGREPYAYEEKGERFLGGGYVRENNRPTWEDIVGVMELPA